MTVSIRPARRDDYAAIAAVGAELQDLHAANRPDVFRPGVPPFPEEVFAAHVAGDPPAVYVAERRDAAGDVGRVVGYVLLAVRTSPPYEMLSPRVIANVEQIGVLAAERGQGAGRALMARAEAWARERGADVLQLRVHEFNADALAFYARVGMTTESRVMEMPLLPDPSPDRGPDDAHDAHDT